MYSGFGIAVMDRLRVCAEGIPQYAVHGKVVSKGQPATGAIVALHPKDKAAVALPYAPRGIVDKDGSFVIGSRTKDDGAPEGDYAVTIIWPKDEDPQKQFDNTPPDRLKNRYNDPNTRSGTSTWRPVRTRWRRSMSNRFFKGRFAQVAVLLAMAMYLVCCGLVIAAEPVPAAAKPAAPIAFVGLHGGVFDVLKAFGGPLGLKMDYVTDEQIRQETVDLARYQVVLLEMVRGDDKDHYRRLIAAAKQRRPDFRVVSISGVAERSLPDLCKLHWIECDPRLAAYYGSVKENVRRMLIYINVTYLHAAGTVLPPLDAEHRLTIYHPDPGESGLMATIDEFLKWSKGRGRDITAAPRAVVTVHSSHLTFQQPKVVDALVRATGEKGPAHGRHLRPGRRLRPGRLREADAGISPAGRRPYLPQHRFGGLSRETGGAAPALDLLPHAVDRRLAAERSRAAPSEMAFHITGQELLGAIEPQIGCGHSSRRR